MKSAARRAPGSSSGDAQAAIERFLNASQKPALLEPGEELLALEAGQYAIESRNSRLTLQAWDQRRNLVRRVMAVHEETRGRLELVVERFGRREGRLLLIDLARPSTRDWSRHGVRLAFRERLRRILSREFPDWRIAELTAVPDLEHTLSPVFPRALLVRGTTGVAAIGAGPDAADASGILSFGLIWLDYLRRRQRRITVESLALFLPHGQERTTQLRLPFLDPRAVRTQLYSYSEDDYAVPLDPNDRGNLDTRLDICRHPGPAAVAMCERLLSIRGVEQIAGHDGEISLRVAGLEFARTRGGQIYFGLAQSVPAATHNAGELEQLARELTRVRAATAVDSQHTLYRRNPEAWLESKVRDEIEVMDATLLRSPIYGQVPAFAAAERGIIDLLAVDGPGRLAVLELKATADVHLPLQALDYWMRVKWHLDRDEFAAAGYFPGIALQPRGPRLLLVAPALEFHPASEVILRFLSPDIEIERIGVGGNWRAGMEIMYRLRGAQRPL